MKDQLRAEASNICLGRHHRLTESEDPCWKCKALAIIGRVHDRIRPRYWRCRDCGDVNGLHEWSCYRCGAGGPYGWFLGWPRWDD